MTNGIQHLKEVEKQLLNGLNDAQKQAVLTVDGTTQICSVAGSGKTRVLTHRIAYMINVLGISPKSIFVTTFTKKASLEMIDRLKKLVDKKAIEDLTIGTTHSICYHILEREYRELNHPMAKNFRKNILEKWEQKKIIQEIKKNMAYGLSYADKDMLREIVPTQVLSIIGFNKNKGINAQQYEEQNLGKSKMTDFYCEIYKQYEYQKQIQHKIDLDDLLYNTVQLFSQKPAILRKYQNQYKYLLIDEAQDNNMLQYTLIKMLGQPENNIFIVGDDDQAMYSFRGATPDQFIQFAEIYNNVTKIELLDNYRSKPQILEVANKLIANNENRLIKFLNAKKSDKTECVNYAVYTNEIEEAVATVDEIKILNEKEGIEYKQMAVLYRTNAQSKSFEDSLIKNCIPYIIHGGISFYERKEIKDIVAYLQLILDPNNDKAFERVINVPNRYLGKAFVTTLKTVKKPHMQALEGLKLQGYQANGVKQFKGIIAGLKGIYDKGESLDSLVSYLLQQGGYEAYLTGDEGAEEEEGNSKMENIETLKYALTQFKSLEEFIAYMELMTSKAKNNINGVQLMSIHKSKGLEFPVVFNVGVSENVLPHYNAIKAVEEKKNPLAIEEERRLQYVAVTRAEARCYISSLMSFNNKGTVPSRFISEMQLIETIKVEDTQENQTA